MLTIDVEYGYNNTAKGGRVLPLTLWIDNREEEDFRGTLEILARQTEEEVYSYAFPLEVEGGGMSPFSCAVPLGTGADSLLIRILDEAGLRDVFVEVDGGVNTQTAPLLTAAGADMLVAGSALYGAEDVKAFIRAVKGN